MKAQTISIIGLDRVGASIGLALKQSPLDLYIVGYSDDAQTAKRAKEMGAVDKTRLSMANVADDGDIIVIAVPFAKMKETLSVVGDNARDHAVIIDIAPLKTPVQKWADEYVQAGHYVSVLPVMSADHLWDTRLSLDAAHPDLFRNSVFCLMPSPTVEETAVQTAGNLGKLLGAEPFYIDAAEYDAYAQAIETLPGLMSAALFRTVTNSNAWRDILRFAGLSFAQNTANMTRESDIAHLAFNEKTVTLRWLDDLINNLIEMRRWVKEGDRETLAALMEELNIQRDSWLHERRQNNWQEAPSQKINQPGIFQQLFIGSRRNKRSDE